ncbi:MAG: hypothetical protein M1812_007333 [Candelaria pacifica]|nr:MAG: hypothetical protein M1812_007333 [Candelaria pacifica]
MADRTQEGRMAVLRIVACDARDYYDILGLDVAAERSAIIKAYQRLSLLVHPDKCKEPGAEDAMQRLNNSKEILTDSNRRKIYDIGRANGKGSRPTPASTMPTYNRRTTKRKRNESPEPMPNTEPE